MKANTNIKKDGKIIAKIYTTKGIDELNAIVHGEAPSRYSEITAKYGAGAYALKIFYKGS